jgi:predicted Rossmann fold flavoprotein
MERWPGVRLAILERAGSPLQKVRISGGGRCNLTHACYDARELVGFYPRGGKELLGPFTRFGPGQVEDWFGSQGVGVKTEGDGRVFPLTDRSATVVEALLGASVGRGAALRLHCGVQGMEQGESGWIIDTSTGKLETRKVLVATGGSARMWELLGGLGHRLVEPVPSLFTFLVRDTRLEGLAGLSIPRVVLRIPDARLESAGPLLITHQGLSGPGVLWLSAWGARWLAQRGYSCLLVMDASGMGSEQATRKGLRGTWAGHERKELGNLPCFGIPKRLWRTLLGPEWVDRTPGSIGSKGEQAIVDALRRVELAVVGKSTHKEEFVTAGGVALGEVDFRTMESKRCPGLYLAGEVLDIDGLTGGFNFQAAWTTAYLAALGMCLQKEH